MISRLTLLTMISLIATSVCAQEPADLAATTPTEDSQMAVPPPVNANPYPTEVASESRSSYLRGGLTFTSMYSDNVFGDVSANPTSDLSYSVWPFIALDETTSRARAVLNFDPGFTFYQRTNGRNEADANLGVNVSYRLSPHVTFSVLDTFHRSSNLLNQPTVPQAPVFGSASSSAATVVA